jgi:hypothetical protein
MATVTDGQVSQQGSGGLVTMGETVRPGRAGS